MTTSRLSRRDSKAASEVRPRCAVAEGAYVADNLAFMARLPDGVCDLIYADPPFDLRQGDLAAFLAFLRPRLVQMHRLLAAHGSLYVHVDWRSAHYVKVMLDEVFRPEHFLNEIIWHYRSGSRPGRWFARKHDNILVYARHLGRHTFNRLRGGDYRTRDLRVGSDGRPFKSTRNGPLYFHPQGPALPDVWDVPFLSTVSRERTGYAQQKPEALLERVIRASSNEGDLVADFFCGSGTTLAVAQRLGRGCLGCDISPRAVGIARRRLAALGVS